MCASIRQAREDLIRQERISTIGRLSGSIVHDLRNPLAAIYGGAEMLVDARPAAGPRETPGRQHLPRLPPHSGTAAGPARTSRAARAGAPRRSAACARWPRPPATRWHAAAEQQGVDLVARHPRRNRAAARAQPHGARLRQPDRQRARSHAGGRRGPHLPRRRGRLRRGAGGGHRTRHRARRSAPSCSSPSSARASATAWAWGWRSPARPCSITAATCGWNPSPAAARASASACPARKPCRLTLPGSSGLPW